MRTFHCSSKTGNRVPPATHRVGRATRASALGVVVFGFLTGLSAFALPSENTPAPANELVRDIIKNELKGEAADHSHGAFQLQSAKAGNRELDQVVEPKAANLQFLA